MGGLLKSGKAAGIATKSFTSTLVDVPSLTEEQDHAIKWSAVSFYGGMFPILRSLWLFIITFSYQAVRTQ